LVISGGDFSPLDVIKGTELNPKDENIKNNPDEYLKPLDIDWRKIGKFIPAYHAAVYLGNSKVAHISGYNPLVDQLKEHQKKLDNEADEWLKSQVLQLHQELKEEKVQEEKSPGGYFKSIFSSFDSRTSREDTKAQISPWKYFLKESKDKLIIHHMIIPFKKPKEIIKCAVKSVFSLYGKNEYHLLKQNCEHFATLCVCGVPFSEQVNKIKGFNKISWEKEMEKNNRFFENLELKNVLKPIRGGMLMKLESLINDKELPKKIKEQLSRLFEGQKNDDWEISKQLIETEKIKKETDEEEIKVLLGKIATILKLELEDKKEQEQEGKQKEGSKEVELREFFEEYNKQQNNQYQTHVEMPPKK
jgi:hypothetical protein